MVGGVFPTTGGVSGADIGGTRVASGPTLSVPRVDWS